MSGIEPCKPGRLALTRAEGQEILIGDDIRIRVTWCRGGQVQLQITAPRETRVMRAELLDQPKRETA